MALKKKKLVTNIIFYTIIVLIYGFVIFQIVVKLNGGNVYLFDVRFDVVLTDSMSSKNENHLDFLEGTTQIQPYDVVGSKKIHDDTELKLKDVVLFKSPDLGGKTVMHRIAEIVQKSDKITLHSCSEYNFDGSKTILMKEYGSFISLSNNSLKYIEVECVSLKGDLEEILSFNFGGKYTEAQVVSTKVDGYYKYTITSYSDTKAEIPSRIYPVALGNYYITNIKYTDNSNKSFEFNASEYIDDNTGSYEAPINIVDYYKLRGDKAKDFDNSGKPFSREELISKVESCIPKVGYVVRFLSSIPGIILLIGLALLITAASYFYNRVDKKNSPQTNETISNSTNAESESSDKKEENNES